MVGEWVRYSGQDIGEGFQDAFDAVRHAAKRVDYWKAFYGVAGVAESYLMQWADIHVHLWRTDGADLCVRFERHPALSQERAADHFAGLDYAHPHRPPRDNDDQIVLVGVVQLAKKPKRAQVTAIPSLIWLKCLDSCDEFRPEVREPISSPPMSSKLTLCPRSESEYGKLSPVVLAEMAISPFGGDNRQLTDELVERRSEIVGNLTDQNRPLNRHIDLSIHEMEAIHSGLLVVLSDSSGAHVTVKEPAALKLKRADVFISRRYLMERPIKRVGHVDARLC